MGVRNKSMKINFYENIEDSLLKFAVIISKYHEKWVFCRHRERDTYEIPGGHREPNESIAETAKRELIEETGALDFSISPVCAYSVTGKNRVNQSGEETYGMLYFAEIRAFSEHIESEIEEIRLFEDMPVALTYPAIQPFLMEEYQRRAK